MFGQEAKIVDAGSADIVDDFDDVAVLSAGIGLDEYALVGAASEPIPF